MPGTKIDTEINRHAIFSSHRKPYGERWTLTSSDIGNIVLAFAGKALLGSTSPVRAHLLPRLLIRSIDEIRILFGHAAEKGDLVVSNEWRDHQ
jgi:hypothetical protein